MAKSKKNNKSSSAKPSVKVRDLKAKKDPKGGAVNLPAGFSLQKIK